MPSPATSLVIALVAALTGAVFASADAAWSSLTSARLAALLEQPELPRRAALERYRRTPWRLRSTYVVGRVLSAATCAILLHEAAEQAWPESPATLLALVGTLALLAPLTELGAALARRSPDAAGPRLATILQPFELLLFPLAAPLGLVTESLADRLRLREAPAPEVMAAEVEHLVDEVERSGAVGAEPAEMIRNVLELEERRARDVMVPRSRIEAFALDAPIDELRRAISMHGHSRYPVYDGELDNVVGLVCAKDVLRLVHLGPSAGTVADLLRKDVVFVAEQQRLTPLLRELRTRRQHLAVVVDEFGGTSGIVTLEDLLSEIVGEIRDEPAQDRTAPIRDLGDGRLEADASIPVGDLSAYLGADIPTEHHDTPLASVLPASPTPELGARFQRWGLELVVREVDERGVQRLEVHRPSAAPPSSSSRPRAGELAPPTQRASSASRLDPHHG